MDRKKKLIETIRALAEKGFSGHIKINFSQGSIGRVEKIEEFTDIGLGPDEKDGKKREEKDISEDHR